MFLEEKWYDEYKSEWIFQPPLRGFFVFQVSVRREIEKALEKFQPPLGGFFVFLFIVIGCWDMLYVDFNPLLGDSLCFRSSKTVEARNTKKFQPPLGGFFVFLDGF